MSFLSILKKIGQVSSEVAPLAIPVVGGFNPIAGAVIGAIFKGIAAAEVPDIPGPTKKVIATNVIVAIVCDMVNAQLARDGQQFRATPAQIEEILVHTPGAIDGAVAFVNSVSAITAIIEKNLAPAPNILPTAPLTQGAQA